MPFGSSQAEPVVQTQQVSTSPWDPQQEYLKEAFKGAQNLYQSDQPQYFPQATVVPFSGQTETALQGMEQIASGGSPLLQAANDTTTATARGDYLDAGNPYFQNMANAAARPIVENYRNAVAPSIDSGFARAGRYGSNAYQQMHETAQGQLGRSLSDMIGSMAFQNYNTERGRQMEGAQMAPGMYQAQLLPSQTLMGVGQTREGQAQAQLADEVSRWNFEQNKEANKLATYLGLVGGGYGSQGNSSTVTPMYQNNLATLLGGATSGLGLASAFGWL